MSKGQTFMPDTPVVVPDEQAAAALRVLAARDALDLAPMLGLAP